MRDRLVREKLLLERKLTLAQALDICRSNESISIQLKKMSCAAQKPIPEEIKFLHKTREQKGAKEKAR